MKIPLADIEIETPTIPEKECGKRPIENPLWIPEETPIEEPIPVNIPVPEKVEISNGNAI